MDNWNYNYTLCVWFISHKINIEVKLIQQQNCCFAKITDDLFLFQDNYNVLHVAAMYSREDVIKSLLVKKGVDSFSTGGVSIEKEKFKVI